MRGGLDSSDNAPGPAPSLGLVVEGVECAEGAPLVELDDFGLIEAGLHFPTQHRIGGHPGDVSHIVEFEPVHDLGLGMVTVGPEHYHGVGEAR